MHARICPPPAPTWRVGRAERVRQEHQVAAVRHRRRRRPLGQRERPPVREVGAYVECGRGLLLSTQNKISSQLITPQSQKLSMYIQLTLGKTS